MVQQIDINTVTGLNEDLTVEENILKFKDRDFEPNTFSGKGYKILRIRNEECNTGNCLSQSDFMDDNTVYEIRYDFDLYDTTIIMPENAVLSIKGGSLKNGIIQGNNTIISGYHTGKFENIQFKGTFILDSDYVVWEEVDGDNNAYACYINEDGKKVKLVDLTSDTINNIINIEHKDSGYQAYCTDEEYRAPLWYDKDDDTWRFADGIRYDIKRYGSTENRPTNVPIGFVYFDTTLGKPMWFTGTGWDMAMTSGEIATNFSATAEASTGPLAATVNLTDQGVFKFQFRIPKGEDGKDGTNAMEGRIVMAYKDSIVKPARPVGGSINISTNQITYPSGWVNAPEDFVNYVWMSQAMFNSFGTIIGEWSDPICLSGEDGEPGKDGNSIEFIFQRTETSNVPETPESVNQDDYVPDGWYDHPQGINAVQQYEWVCSRRYNNGSWGAFTAPGLWSKWSVNGVDGDGVEYIFTRTRQEVKPTRPISGNEDDFIPEGWTDNPLGVNSEYRYEWACMRKYIGSIKQWGEFNEPAIWAKWSEDGAPGEPGNTIKVMYAITEAATVVPPLVKTNVNPGSIWQATVPTLTGSKVLWRIEAMFTVRNELVGEWSDPVLISGTASAAPGEYTEFRYAASDSDTVYPELAKDERDPAGWTTTVPELGEEQFLWMTNARINGYDDTLLFPWCDPIRMSGIQGPQGKPGLDGVGSAILDIDNEMTQVLCDRQGNVLGGLPITIHFNMYYGDDEVTITSIAETSVLGVGITTSVEDKSATISTISPQVDDVINIVFTVQGNYAERTFERSVVFKIIKVIEGQDALMYQLNPAVSIIKVDKTGAYSEPAIYCGVNKIDGQTVESLVSLDRDLRMTYAIDSQAEQSYTLNEDITTNNIQSRIVFKLYRDNIMIDVETIPIVQDAKPNNWFSYVYKKSDTKPEKPDSNDPNPEGWSDYPDDTGQWWQCIGTVDGLTNKVIQWSTVLPVNGRDGQAMDGKRTEFRFAVNNSDTNPPLIDNHVREPEGWTTQPPEVESGEYLWMTTCLINPDDTINGAWSDPVRISGEQGAPGLKGDTGPMGPVGNVGPAGHDGVDGLPGISFEIRYSRGTEDSPTASTSTSTLQQRYPSGWSTSIPNVTTTYPYIWCIQARIDPSDDSIEGGQWQLMRLSGINGLDGETEVNRSQVVYPAGIYDVNTTYVCDENKTPYVYDTQTGKFYVLNVVTSWRGSSMGYQYPNDAPSYWVEMEDYEAIYAKLGIIAKGSIGELYFNDAFVYSHYGNNGSSNHYEDFNPSGDDAMSSSWKPCFAINCETGEVWMGTGKSYFKKDGSGKLANGNISWDSSGNLTVRGDIDATGGSIGGWQIDGNRLVSENGKVWLDGGTGQMRLQGTLQQATHYGSLGSDFSDANIFYLPATSSSKTIYLGQDSNYIGKVCRFYNSGSFGQASYNIQCYSFTANKTSGSSSAYIEYSAALAPQETVEMTCLEVSSTSTTVTGRWEVTSRFSQRDMWTSGAKGRYPLVLGMGLLTGTGSSCSISGTWWDGRTAQAVLSCSRLGSGQYRISFSSSNVPSGYIVFATGYGYALNLSGHTVKASVTNLTSTNFRIETADDDTNNDGSAYFMIMSPNWQYNMQ